MSGHYFTVRPDGGDAPRTVRFRVAGEDYELTASGGVFSADRLDPGTAVLLREAPAPAGDTLLDLGCGWGPIALTLARRAPAATVWAIDVNERALALTRANAAADGAAARVRAVSPDDVPDDVRFDEIWTNPPIRVGKAALHALLLRWLPRLAPGGTAWLVVGRNLGADPLQRWLREQGYDCVRAGSAKGFRVLRVRPAAAAATATAPRP